MSKKTVKKTADETQDAQAEQKAKQTSVESASKNKASASKKQQKQKAQKRSGVAKKLKETRSELKKITWPSFAKVVRKTSVVIAVVIMFTIMLFAIDRLLGWLFSLLTSS